MPGDGKNVKVVLTAENQTKPAFSAAEAQIEQLRAVADSALAKIGTLGAAFGLALGARELIETGNRALELGRDLDLMREKTGLSVEQLSSLRYAGKLTGVDFDQVGGTLNLFTKNVLQAAETGTGKAALAFKALGINVRDSQGNMKSVGDLLQEVAVKVTALGPGFMESGTAAQLFGRQGANLVPLLKELANGWGNLEARAKSSGAFMSGATAAQLHATEEAVAKLKAEWEGFAVRGMAAAAPGLKVAAENTAALNKEGSDGEKVFRAFGAIMAVMTLTTGQYFDMVRGAGKLDFPQIPFKAPGPPPEFIAKAPPSQANPPDLTTVHEKKPAQDQAYLEALKRLEDAEVALRKANADQVVTIAKAEGEAELQALDEQYKQGLLSTSDYYQKRADAIRGGVAIELDALKAERESLQDDYKAKTSAPGYSVQPAQIADADKTLAQITALDTKIQALGIETDSKLSANDAARIAREKEVADFVASMEARIREAKGQTAAVAIAAIDKEFEAAKKMYAQAGMATPANLAALDQLKQQEIAGAQAKALSEQIRIAFEQEAAAEQQLRDLEAQGGKKNIETETAVNAIRQQSIDKIKELIAQYQALAAASGQPALKLQAADFDKQLADLGKRAKDVSQVIQQSLSGAIQTFLDTIARGKSPMDALRAAAKSLIDSIASMLSRMAAQQIMGNSSVGGLLNGLFAGFSSGGSGGASAGMPGGSGVGAFANFAGGMAGGGDLSPGDFALVGEDGPELFAPGTSGTVIPRDQLTPGGHSFSFSTTINAPGADPNSAEMIRRALERNRQESIHAAMTAINEQKLRR